MHTLFLSHLTDCSSCGYLNINCTRSNDLQHSSHVYHEQLPSTTLTTTWSNRLQSTSKLLLMMHCLTMCTLLQHFSCCSPKSGDIPHLSLTTPCTPRFIDAQPRNKSYSPRWVSGDGMMRCWPNLLLLDWPHLSPLLSTIPLSIMQFCDHLMIVHIHHTPRKTPMPTREVMFSCAVCTFMHNIEAM